MERPALSDSGPSDEPPREPMPPGLDMPSPFDDDDDDDDYEFGDLLPEADYEDAPKSTEEIEIGGRQGISLDRPNVFRVLAIVFRWLRAITIFGFWMLFLRKKKERAGYRARRLVERMGGPAIVLVRQFAMRLELMPLEFAAELGQLTDFTDPMPLEKAFEEFQRYQSHPVEDVFETFDPQPILSTFMSDIYQAVLHSGPKCAVQIMKPEAPMKIHTERIALELVLRLLALVFPGYKSRLRSVKDELPFIESELLDYVRLARTHNLLKKNYDRWRLQKEFHVASVYTEHCSKNVVVSEFIEGFWLHEVLGAFENDDKEALATLASHNIIPAKCADRLIDFGLWSMLENVFGLAAPRASQFGVMPNNELVVVQIGTVTMFGRHQKRMYRTILELILARDFEGIADLLIQSLFPLPLIDVHQFSKQVEKQLVLQLVALENKDSPASVRSGTGLWLSFLEEAKRFGVIVPLELSRMIQSTCTFFELAFRLDPKLKLRRELRRYLTRSLRRDARDTERFFRNPDKRGGTRFTSRPQEVTETIERGRWFLERTFEMVPLAFLATNKPITFSMSQLLTSFFLVAKVSAAWLLVQVGIHWWRGVDIALFNELWTMFFHPAYLTFIGVLSVITARRIQYRLDDLDG